MLSSRVAAMLALVLPLGCQFVFGIDEYEPGAPGSGSAGASGGAGGVGGMGGMGREGGAGGEGSRGGEGGSGSSSLGGNGTGGNCACADGDGWSYVAFDKVVASDDQLLTTMCNGQPRVNVFGGASGACSDCTSAPQASSCAAPGLRCFDSGCSGNSTVESPGSNCGDLVGFGSGYDNCTPEGPVGQPLCANAVGGLPTTAAPVLGASFCGGCSYCVAEEADCIVNDSTVPASTCDDLGFPFSYTLRESPEGSPQCTACGAPEANCNGEEVPYSVGALFVCDVDLDVAECSGLSLTTVKFGRYNVTSSCSSAAAQGSFNYTAPARTVCCKTDELGPFGLPADP